MSNFSLIELTAEQQALEAVLIENGGELTPELEQELNENAAAIVAKVDGYHAVLRKFEMAETAVDAEIKRLTALKKTAQNAQKTIKAHIAYGMQVSGLEKLDGSLCKLSFRKSKAVNTDEATLLAPYEEQLRTFSDSLPDYIGVEVKVSKTALKSALEAGVPVEGAEIVENYNLQIR